MRFTRTPHAIRTSVNGKSPPGLPNPDVILIRGTILPVDVYPVDGVDTRAVDTRAEGKNTPLAESARGSVPIIGVKEAEILMLGYSNKSHAISPLNRFNLSPSVSTGASSVVATRSSFGKEKSSSISRWEMQKPSRGSLKQRSPLIFRTRRHGARHPAKLRDY